MRLFGAFFWAIPVYFLWNHFAPIYMADLPPQYLDVPYWHIAGLFVLIRILTFVVIPHRFARHHHAFHRFGCGGFGRFRGRRFWKHATMKYYHES